MKQKKSKKSKAVKLPVGELIGGKPWQAFIEALPSDVQRLGIHVMEAYDKGNDKRMRQYLSQMRGLENTEEMKVFLLLLYWLYSDQDQTDGEIRTLEEVLAKEEANPCGGISGRLDEILSFAPETVRGILKLSHDQRIRRFHFLLGPLYLQEDRLEEAAGLYEKEYPFDPENADGYYHYLQVLTFQERTGDCQRLAGEIISLYGNESYDPVQESSILTARSPAIKATAVMDSYFIRFSLILDEDDPSPSRKKEADEIITDAMDFLRRLPDPIKRHFLFRHSFADLIVQTSMRTEDDKYRAPFKAILDAAKASHVFDIPGDADEIFSDLLPSGYRVLERISCENDPGMNHFVAGMLLDIELHRNELKDLPGGSGEAYNARQGIACCKWYLCRYQSESGANREKALADFAYMKQNYPYLWDVIRDDAEILMEDPITGMETLAEEILKNARGRKSWGELRQGMEEAYLKTYEQAMEEATILPG